MADTNPKPGTRKVTVGALSGAIVTVVVYYLSTTGIQVPAEVVAAATTLVTALLVYRTTETFTQP